MNCFVWFPLLFCSSCIFIYLLPRPGTDNPRRDLWRTAEDSPQVQPQPLPGRSHLPSTLWDDRSGGPTRPSALIYHSHELPCIHPTRCSCWRCHALAFPGGWFCRLIYPQWGRLSRRCSGQCPHSYSRWTVSSGFRSSSVHQAHFLGARDSMLIMLGCRQGKLWTAYIWKYVRLGKRVLHKLKSPVAGHQWLSNK